MDRFEVDERIEEYIPHFQVRPAEKKYGKK